jgi:hypothetical protein
MNELNRENAISISEVIQEFLKISSSLEKQHNVVIHLAEIQGRRWSYLEGSKSKKLSPLLPRRIMLTNYLGLIVYGMEETTLNVEQIKGKFKKIEKLLFTPSDSNNSEKFASGT